jgi:F-type H+-transporting ATPase subunit delta
MALKSTEVEILSQRYAKALFDFSIEKNLGEVLSQNFNSLSQLISENPELSRALSSPITSKGGLTKALAEIADKAGYNAEVKNVLKTLVDNRRTELVPYIANKLNALFDKKAGRINVEVKSASKLDDAQLSKISEKIEASVKAKPVIKNIVDESLIGGLTVKIGSKLFDDSIKGRLERLKQHLNS